MIVRIHIIIISWIAKTLAFLSKMTGKGSGTSLPGLLVENKYKFLLKPIAKSYDNIIMISGTNGKTTTRALLVDIYEQNGVKVCTNRGGANIYRGLAASLLLDLSFWGKPKSKVAILEVEEATLPILTEYVKPNILVLTNVFRDQLDVYGEVDKTLSYFEKTLEQVNPVVYANADDQKLLSCLKDYDGKVVGFSLGEEFQKPDYEKSEKYEIEFEELYFAVNHSQDPLEQSFQISSGKEFVSKIKTRLPGVYNIYNILPAVLLGGQEFSRKEVESAVAGFAPVFGRGEVIEIGQNTLKLYLIKNPAGFNQVLEYLHLIYKNRPIRMAFLINDNIADGKDVSWLWDADLESFSGKQEIAETYTGGSRGFDMLLRLEYAGFEVSSEDNHDRIVSFVDRIQGLKGETSILCTYTALLELRKELGKRVDLPSIGGSGN